MKGLRPFALPLPSFCFTAPQADACQRPSHSRISSVLHLDNFPKGLLFRTANAGRALLLAEEAKKTLSLSRSRVFALRDFPVKILPS